MNKEKSTLLEQNLDQITIQIRQTQEVLLNKVDVLEKDQVYDHPYNQGLNDINI